MISSTVLKRNITTLFSAALLLGGFATSAPLVHATTMVGGLSFNDNAFADDLIGNNRGNGYFATPGGGRAMLGSDLTAYTWARSDNNDPRLPEGIAPLLFLDNLVVNDTGPDLALFGIGTAHVFLVALTISDMDNGLSIPFLPIATGATIPCDPTCSPSEPTAVYSVNLALVDISVLGVPTGGQISQIVIGLDPGGAEVSPNGPVLGNASALAVVGALNSLSFPIPDPSKPIPEPSTMLLLGSGLVGLIGYRMRKVQA